MHATTPTLAPALAVALAAAASSGAAAGTVDLLPADGSLPPLALYVTQEDDGIRFDLGEVVEGTVLGLVLEDGLVDELGFGSDYVASTIALNDEDAVALDALLGDAAWQGSGTLLVPQIQEIDPGVATQSAGVTYDGTSLTHHEVLAMLESEGTRVGVVVELPGGEIVAYATDLPDPVPTEPAPGPIPTTPPVLPIPTPVAGALGFALLAAFGGRSRR